MNRNPQQLEFPLRHERHNLQVMQMQPGTAERLELLRELEVSCRPGVKLRRAAGVAYYATRH
jgi:hypothetical protein